MSYKEYKQLNMTQIGKEIRKFWEENETFEKGQQLAEGHPTFVFYDGPPSANGKPGIHHVLARTIKDVFGATPPDQKGGLCITAEHHRQTADQRSLRCVFTDFSVIPYLLFSYWRLCSPLWNSFFPQIL